MSRPPARLGLVLDQIVFESREGLSTDEPFIQFVAAMAREGRFQVQFCSRVRAAEKPAPYPLDPAIFEVIPLPWYPDIRTLCARAPRLLPQISRRIRAQLPTWALALTFGLHPVTPLTLRLARRHGIPGALWVRGDLRQDLSHRFSGASRWLARALAGLTEALIPSGTPVIAVGRDDYPFLRRMGPVHVVYSSKFDQDDFRPPRPPRDDRPGSHLLYVGRIAPEKGLDTLLDALRMLGPECRLTLAGGDHHGSPYGERFAARVRSLDLASRVTFSGHVPYGPPLFRLYDRHDLLVLPSHTEGFPQVILEAMARGLPLVATRVGGVPRLVRDGETGTLVEAGDAAGLARAVKGLLGDPEHACRLARKAQEVLPPFTRAQQVRHLVEFLRRTFPSAVPAGPDAGMAPLARQPEWSAPGKARPE